MSTNKKYSFWKDLKDFFTISDKELKAWKKKNYGSRQQIGFTSPEEDKQYDEEFDKKNRRD